MDIWQWLAQPQVASWVEATGVLGVGALALIKIGSIITTIRHGFASNHEDHANIFRRLDDHGQRLSSVEGSLDSHLQQEQVHADRLQSMEEAIREGKT